MNIFLVITEDDFIFISTLELLLRQGSVSHPSKRNINDVNYNILMTNLQVNSQYFQFVELNKSLN